MAQIKVSCIYDTMNCSTAVDKIWVIKKWGGGRVQGRIRSNLAGANNYIHLDTKKMGLGGGGSYFSNFFKNICT